MKTFKYIITSLVLFTCTSLLWGQSTKLYDETVDAQASIQSAIDLAAKQGKHEHAPEKSEAPQALHRTLGEQRKLLNSLVGMYSRVSGDPHASIHTELRRVCGGPAVAQASVTQLQQRIELLRRRLGS